MIKNIEYILEQAGVGTAQDFLFLLAADVVEDKEAIYNMVYGRACRDIDKFVDEQTGSNLYATMKTHGIVGQSADTISRSENMSEMISLLKRIKEAQANNLLEPKDALKMESDIRTKLQDKFDIQGEGGQQRLIVLPAKHDLICPHTGHECYQWPSEEACIKHYNIKKK